MQFLVYLHDQFYQFYAYKQGIAITFVTEKEQAAKERIEALMNYKIPILPTPEHLEISDVLIDDEKPKKNVKEIKLKPIKKEDVGASFHEKSAKNQKVNFIVRKKDRMMKKYGKPITRGAKKK